MEPKRALQVQVRNLSLRYPGGVQALRDVSFELYAGETLGIVGESGCGKSITSLAVMRLLPQAAKVAGGSVSLRGENLLEKTEAEMHDIRGKDVAMIFQDPLTCLNPVLTIGFQIGEAIKRHNPRASAEEIDLPPNPCTSPRVS